MIARKKTRFYLIYAML